eukprot:CAMPEP_0181093316 /NCGR_PEP_ID=MMETSP1071-20121207/9379_1 /TAXON_ID=35127 /ORGANISM="Thalassiosira sp., Strain NH16" /LENGTH=65 /DNA_ID=CAMNT_0023175539 /DNA_START=97 /DNA_END=290 /DNA_ORIENTATION=+
MSSPELAAEAFASATLSIVDRTRRLRPSQPRKHGHRVSTNAELDDEVHDREATTTVRAYYRDSSG